jgi:[protein-PII] uridylyltransferase
MAAPAPVPDAARLDTARIDAGLRAGDRPANVYAEALAAVDTALDGALDAGTSAHDVVAARAVAVDELLSHAWYAGFGDANGDIALVAVGGYGRGELHPHSDIDLLILLADGAEDRHREAIETFVTLLWDIGLEIGQAVRTVTECVEAARADVTTATNLMESRLLAGAASLHDSMQAATGPDQVWPPETFFRAKLDEQKARHRKFDRTAYRLEPNIKEGPGGLRDIQMVGWVAKRHFGAHTLAELVDHGFLTDDEYHRLVHGQELLWAIRWRLHRMTGRSEDRLLFDHQRDLAVAFGETGDDPNRAVEAFMQRYYRAVMELQRLNEILLQFFREAILEPPGQPVVRRLNERFRIRGETLEIAAPDVFRREPRAMIEMYLLLARHPEVRGVRAETLRRLRDDLDGIDDRVRGDPEAKRLFMELLRQPWRVASQLFRMNRYGVLGAYIPAFDRIVGRMQYDLFHTYTVDEHTLRVIRNLREFRAPDQEADGSEFPLCLELMADLDEPELLYVAALFHDIAKGRDGDHSELGAVDAEAFCRDHGLSSVQTGLVSWLVRHHLLMSMTAQRRDLSDPAVIHEFARTVSSVSHLNHLYLLTVADIRATNPTLWNSWKDNLLRELYHKTVQALWRGLDNPIDKDERIAEVQHHARRQLAAWALDVERIDTLWADLGDAYFLRHNADEIVWHTRGLLEHGERDDALILLRRETQRGSTELFISRPDHRYRFALVTTVLDRLGLSIVDARVLTSRSGRALDTYLILEASGEPITDDYRIADIRAGLEDALADPERLPDQPARRTPRRMRHFDVPLVVEAEDEPEHGMTAVEVTASDQPGLLSKIARAFLAVGVRVHSARVATIGERVDDVFFITDSDNRPVDEATVRAVERELAHRISNPGAP